MKRLPNGRKRILYLDNYSGHRLTEGALAAANDINTQIRFFPPNRTDLIQPCNSYIVQKIKSACQKRWEKYEMELIQSGRWKDSSDRITNPGKSYFLRLAAYSVRDVNKQREADRLSYARKAMILT